MYTYSIYTHIYMYTYRRIHIDVLLKICTGFYKKKITNQKFILWVLIFILFEFRDIVVTFIFNQVFVEIITTITTFYYLEPIAQIIFILV